MCWTPAPRHWGSPSCCGLNPQIIAVDEITVREDLRAVHLANGCGVRLLATIHADSVEGTQAQALHAQLLERSGLSSGGLYPANRNGTAL